MTRINTISVQELHTKHLVAEYRELPRIFGVAKKAEERGFLPATYKIPDNFTLGTGHVKFFSNKLLFLINRFNDLVAKCQARGINVQHTSVNYNNMPKNKLWFNDWIPTEESKRLIRERIAERIDSKPKAYLN